jgi:hypothetical protein
VTGARGTYTVPRMGFFDFLGELPRYAEHAGGITRLNKRYDFLIAPYVDEIAGSSVLDIASHDGRWSYALSAAGAREVVGIEGRQETIDQFADYPTGPEKDRVRFLQGDVYEVLPQLVEEGKKFDVVALFGIFYHVMDHYLLLKLIHRLEPRLIIVDSEFYLSDEPTIRLFRESTDAVLHSIAHIPGQQRTPSGIPSKAAFTWMTDSLGYTIEWADWQKMADQRGGIRSYFREPPEWKRRDTCALRPVD